MKISNVHGQKNLSVVINKCKFGCSKPQTSVSLLILHFRLRNGVKLCKVMRLPEVSLAFLINAKE